MKNCSTADVVADLGEAFLGSRLKRLAERMQGGATRFVNSLGLNVQPTHMGLLAALDRSPMTVGQLVEAVGTTQPGVTRGVGQLISMGLVESESLTDRRQRALPALQRLLVTAPQLAIWDDHDYGPNDSDMSYVLKGRSLELFRRYWANPSYGLPDVPGIFGLARFGDVDVFLLDDRWYRSANRMNDEPGKTMSAWWADSDRKKSITE